MKGLYFWLRRTADDLEKNFGVRFPEYNLSPVLWNIVDSLGGCREFCVALDGRDLKC